MKSSKSVLLNKFGDLNFITVEDCELPSLEGNLEVKVEYGGVNFADIYTIKGLVADKKLPFVLGIECSGVITAIGDNVKNDNFKVGERVVCYDYTGGLYRNTLRLPPTNCFSLPKYIDSKLGAAIFVNYLTAYFSLIHLGNLRENESILILSCAGGVGSAAVQISKTVAGAHISGSGSAIKEARARENGVENFFCNETFVEKVKDQKFDVILCNESGPTFSFLQGCLKPLGRIILIGANNLLQTENALIKTTENTENQENVPLLSLLVNNRAVSGLHLGTLLATDPEKVKNTLDRIFLMVKEQKLNPIIHSEWKMSEFIKAAKLLEERKNVGKILINMFE
ncbi:synaptic vesicle membrane protein VAT-1 homolog [Diorhabda sublineata]|uniref:synaptic vesicle membrane protein VAT-1 homolog n=1 Tax=Diorhabda sublineata TaxID=1163346 RepID=UPI0024E10D18|nr:synaptic vesicle membrane protein VAT-1 homolog [Diorhabda sublineata]